MQFNWLAFAFFFFFLPNISESKCPFGQELAHDGNCAEVFSLKISPINITRGNKAPTNIIDVPITCSGDKRLDHTGNCIEPFTLRVPDNTSTTESSATKIRPDRTRPQSQRSTTPSRVTKIWPSRDRPQNQDTAKTTTATKKPKHH